MSEQKKEPGQVAYEAWHEASNWDQRWYSVDSVERRAWSAVEQAITASALQRIDEAVANAERRAREEVFSSVAKVLYAAETLEALVDKHLSENDVAMELSEEFRAELDKFNASGAHRGGER